ncbi:MAG TPA: prepilin-type N-terminal cleavage/methylation domain-containing protein [Candidatus Limnocylindrales bacterium]|nr:prepilin-type N-terminal cleavage/methylation domain-containing protein [Candidatus Limnocylindrales bacterium]
MVNVLRRGPRVRATGGFTLLEVLIAVTILGVAIVSLLGLHARDVRLISEAQDITVAGALASDILAAARVDPDLEEGILEGSFVGDPRRADGKQLIYGGPDAERFVWVRQVLPTALPTLRQVRVIVRPAGEGRTVAELWSVVRLDVEVPRL